MATPSVQEYLVFSQLAYDLTGGESSGVTVPSQWSRLNVWMDTDSGLNVIAYKNETTEQIIVAFRGTDPTSTSDLSIDAHIGAGIRPDAFKIAEEYVQGLREDNPDYSFFVTGHSLGGAIAQDVAAKLYLRGISFGAPGVANLLSPGVSPSAPNFINYIINTDPIGNATVLSGVHVNDYEASYESASGTVILSIEQYLADIALEHPVTYVATSALASHALAAYGQALFDVGLLASNPLPSSLSTVNSQQVLAIYNQWTTAYGAISTDIAQQYAQIANYIGYQLASDVQISASTFSQTMTAIGDDLLALYQDIVDSGSAPEDDLSELKANIVDTMQGLGYYIVQPGDTADSIALTLSHGGMYANSIDAQTLMNINAAFGITTLDPGTILHVPTLSSWAITLGEGMTSLSPLSTGQAYVLDGSTLYTVGASLDGHDSGALIIDTPSFTGTFQSFAQGTYAAAGHSYGSGLLGVKLTDPHTGVEVGTYNLNSTLTLYNGTVIALPTSGGIMLTDILAETAPPLDVLLSYLAQLGNPLTLEELAELDFNYQHPGGSAFTVNGIEGRDIIKISYSDSGTQFFESGLCVTYRLGTTPGAIIIGQETMTSHDASGYEIQVPAINRIFVSLMIDVDFSQDIISNIDILIASSLAEITLTRSQFDSIATFYVTESITAADGGTFSLANKSADSHCDLIASALTGTTLIGNNQNGQFLYTSHFGNDTLIAGNGNGVYLYNSGYGVNTLIGGLGGTTFYTSVDPTAGTVFQGNGENNTLEIHQNCNITDATISGIQTLRVARNVTLTADQFNQFQSIEISYSGTIGTIYAATGGSYDLQSKNPNHRFDMYASSSVGTTLIGNDADYETLTASTSGNDTLIAGNGIGATLVAGLGNNTLTGGTGDNILIGNIGDDLCTGGGGDDTIIGGDGKDIAFYSGAKSEYTLTNINGTWTITDSVEGRDGTDTFTEFEYLQFADQLYTVPSTGILSVELNGGAWVEQIDGTFTFSGDVSIGLKNGNPYIITVTDATYVLDDHNLTINGTFTSIIDGYSRPLFTGQTSLSLTGADGALNWSTTLYEAAGLKPSFTSLTLANNDLRLQFDTWGLPNVLASGPLSLDPDTFIITTAGPRLGVSGSVEFPDISFKLLDIVSILATDWSVSYDASQDQLAILGGFILKPGWTALPSIHAELTGDGLIIQDGDVADVALKVSLDDFAIKGWGFKNVSFSLDTDDNNFTGQASLTLPFASTYSVAAQLGFTLSPFELDSATLSVTLPDPGIPVFSTGWYITSLGGGISNLASTIKAPVLISGTIGLESTGDLMEMEVNGELDSNHLKGSVNGNIIDTDLIKFDGNATVDWNKNYVKVASNAIFVDGLITGSFNFQSDFDLNLSVRGTAQVKILKQTLAGNYYLLFSNDGDLSNDYVAGWVSIQVSLPLQGSTSVTKGVKYSFDGKISTFGANKVPLYASWIVDDTLTDLMVTAEWENAATAPVQTRVIVYDDLSKTQIREIINEADYTAHNIAVIDAWSSEYAKVVYVATPDPGVWDVEVVNADGLGTITYSADTTRAEGSLALDGVTIDANIVTLDYSAINGNGVATLYFFADNDNDGYDGILIGSATEQDGSGQFIWDGSSFEGGHYWLYGIMEDGVSVPISTYAAESVHIIQPNQAPLLYYPIADMAATAGVAFSLQIAAGSFVDLDTEDSLTFSASLANGDPLPDWLTFDPSTETFSGTPAKVDAGELDIQIIASDTSAATASDIFRLTVALPESPTSFLNIAATSANKAEGNSGSTAFTFTVTRSGSTAGTSSVTYAVSGATVTDNDFTGGVLPSDTITFAAGETNRTITINVAGDTTVESAENFTVTLSNPTGATIEIATATGIIENDDTIAPALIKGTWGNDTLCGGPGHNTIYGYAGNDSLDGGADADTMLGGLGSDTYYVDDTGDVVTETRYWRRENGVDTVIASIDWTLGANCENLTITGGAKQATGNGLHNILIGNDGDNILDGKGGADTMRGGLGNDIYVVDKLADQTLETADPLGIDTVLTSVNRTLGANLENLTLTGTRAINGAGNNQDNILLGNDAANKLRGAGGNDTLTGGGGQDIFYFDTPLDEQTNVDTITDFTVGEDLLRLDRSIFSSLTAGALEANQFCVSTTGQASDGNDFLLYNTSNGDLLYDADGNGAGAAIRFATLHNHPSITAASCLVVG